MNLGETMNVFVQKYSKDLISPLLIARPTIKTPNRSGSCLTNRKETGFDAGSKIIFFSIFNLPNTCGRPTNNKSLMKSALLVADKQKPLLVSDQQGLLQPTGTSGMETVPLLVADQQ
jgi:hypothetical protein